MKNLLLAACLLLLPALVHSQEKYPKNDFASQALWVPMMDDTLVNFYTVENAFEVYFQHHELPAGEEEEINEHRERGKFPNKRKQHKMWMESSLRREVKRYRHWHDRTLPYVREDGRIMTPSERLAMFVEQAAK